MKMQSVENLQHAARAERAILAFMRPGDSREDAITDLLADLGHWCDLQAGIKFDRVVDRAVKHWRLERGA